jgi:hypothetical protein
MVFQEHVKTQIALLAKQAIHPFAYSAHLHFMNCKMTDVLYFVEMESFLALMFAMMETKSVLTAVQVTVRLLKVALCATTSPLKCRDSACPSVTSTGQCL